MGNWKIGESQTLLHTFIWDVIETEKTAPSGKTGNFVSLRCPNWVKAVIFNKNTHRFLLCHEYRQGVDGKLYEFPSGTVEDGESPEAACIREIEEETGYKVESIRLLISRNPNPAFMSNSMSIYYAEVSGTQQEQHLDDFEDLTIIEVENPKDYLDGGLMDELAWMKYIEMHGSSK